MLDTTILQQVKDVFKDLTHQYTFKVTAHPQHEKAAELKEFINDFVSTSQLFKAQFVKTDDMTIQFSLLKDDEETGVMFRHTQRSRVHVTSFGCPKCRRQGQKPAR